MIRLRFLRAAVLPFAVAITVAAVAAIDHRVPPVPSPAPVATAKPPASPTANETYLWRPVKIGGGGFITGLAADARGVTRLGRADVHGAYRWDAAFNRWVQLASAATMPERFRTQNGINAGAYEVAVAPNDPRRLYMAIKGRVFRSDDGGDHWNDPPDGAPFPLAFDANSEFRQYGPFLAVDPNDSSLVLFGTPHDGLWRSADAGRTWSRVASVPASADLRGGPGVQAPGVLVWFVGRRLYAASAGSGVWVSDDRGLSFAPLAPGGPRTVVQASAAPDGTLYAVEQEAKQAWRFGGGRWNRLPLPAASFAGVAVNRLSWSIFVTDVGGRAWCSSDSGRSWSTPIRGARPGDGEPPWLRLNNESYFASAQIAFDPTAPTRLWVAAGTGPYIADVGLGCPWRMTWISRVRGIEEIVANDAVQPPGQAPLFAGWDFGIHRKPDLDAFSTSFAPKERLLVSAQQIAWSPRNPAFLVTNASDARMCCSEDGDAVLAGYSTDGGRTWRKFATLPIPPGTRPDDPWRMSFGTIAVAADSIDNIVWAPAFNRSPFFTRDRGQTWRRVVLPGEAGPLTGSFERLYGARKTLAADRVLPGTFYLVHSGDGGNRALAGLWRTSDGGERWTRVFSGEIAPESRFSAKLRAVPGQAGHLFFTSASDWGQDLALRRSTDGGAHWAMVPGVDHVDDIAFGKAAAGAGYPTIFVSGRVNGSYGIWRSTDAAQRWQRVAGFPIGRLDQVSVIEADPDVFGRVYVGYTGSGWVYGMPMPCVASPFKAGDNRECVGVAAR